MFPWTDIQGHILFRIFGANPAIFPHKENKSLITVAKKSNSGELNKKQLLIIHRYEGGKKASSKHWYLQSTIKTTF